MTVSEALDKIAYAVGELSAPNTSAEKTRRISFINDGISAISASGRYWFNQKSATITGVSGQSNYSLPSDFSEVISLMQDDIPYHKASIVQATDGSLANSLIVDGRRVSWGAPYNYYYLFGDEIVINPTPDTGDMFTLKYYGHLTSVSDDDDELPVPSPYDMAIVQYATHRVYKDTLKLRGSAADALAEYNETLGRIIAEDNARRMRDVSVVNPLVLL